MKAKKFIKDNNFINIHGWMINKLQLSGNQLLIFACIYGFSQDGKSWFEGTRAYLAEWCGIGCKYITMNLKQLCDMGLLIKEERIVNHLKSCRYKVNFETLDQMFYQEEEKADDEERDIEDDSYMEDVENKESMRGDENFLTRGRKDPTPKHSNFAYISPEDTDLEDEKLSYRSHKDPTRSHKDSNQGHKDSTPRVVTTPNNKKDNKNNTINLPSFLPSENQGEGLPKNEEPEIKAETRWGLPLTAKELYKFTKHLTKKQLNYDDFITIHPQSRELLDNILDIIVDVKCSNLKTMRIGQEEKPIEVVKSQFHKLRLQHVEQVIENLDNNVSKIRNFKPYIITSLYNSLFTLHYQRKADFNHLYNKGLEEE